MLLHGTRRLNVMLSHKVRASHKGIRLSHEFILSLKLPWGCGLATPWYGSLHIVNGKTSECELKI